MRAIAIAGTHSGCGKTTVTLGLIAAFRKKGLKVQPFKTGPDFIDAGLHRLIANRSSRNLDLWMCGEDFVLDTFSRHTADADIGVVEGVMGMYDGHASTAGLARFLQVPVVLVVDAYGMAQSAGAMVKGFHEFGMQNAGNVACVIFNRVSSEAHFRMLKESVQGVAVAGYLTTDLDFEIPNRHLGLMVAEEHPLTAGAIDKLANTVLDHIDLDSILRIAGKECCPGIPGSERNTKDTKKFTVAMAYDKAFCFYYEDNLDALKNAGAEIVRFSPLSDAGIPGNADAVYLGGGYPEVHAAELSLNSSMLESIRNWSNAGKPLYAECGGLMYLSQGIHDMSGSFFRMSGVFPFETRMKKQPRLGYREIVLNEDCILGQKGDTCRGHEFHYSDINGDARGQLYKVRDQSGETIGHEGFRYKNTVASYIHLHFGGNQRIADNIAVSMSKIKGL